MCCKEEIALGDAGRGGGESTPMQLGVGGSQTEKQGSEGGWKRKSSALAQTEKDFCMFLHPYGEQSRHIAARLRTNRELTWLFVLYCIIIFYSKSNSITNIYITLKSSHTSSKPKTLVASLIHLRGSIVTKIWNKYHFLNVTV